MYSFIIFLFGLIVGSFLNCVIYYLEGGRKALGGRSFCPFCKHQLSWEDLIPVLSFLLLRGKCRYCHKKVSWQYPLIELGTAILFVLVFSFFGGFLYLIYLLVIISLLIIVFVYDLKHYLIPDKIVYPLIIISLAYNFNYVSVLAALGSAMFFLIIFLISRGKGMGFGDVKLALFMGLFLSWPKVLAALLLAFFIGALVGMFLIVLGKRGLKSEIPFGPFLVVGTLIALFLGNLIINKYLSLIGV